VSLWRPSLTHYVSNAADVQSRAGDLFEWIRTGRLTVKIGNVFGLAAAADAHRTLEGRQSMGKILLVP
jgi:NADPH2:quinone reductase